MFLGQSAQDVIDLQLPGTAPAPSGVTPTETGITPNSFWSNLTGLIPAGISAYQQIQLQNLNMNLVKQGRPPLTAAQMAQMAPQLNVGIAPGTQTLLMYGGLAVAAMFMLSQLGKHIRRRG